MLLSGVLDLLRRPDDRDLDLFLFGDLDLDRLCFALDFFFLCEGDLDLDFLSSCREDDFDLDLAATLDFVDLCWLGDLDGDFESLSVVVCISGVVSFSSGLMLSSESLHPPVEGSADTSSTSKGTSGVMHF